MELDILKEKLIDSKEISEHKFEILKSIATIYNKSDNQSVSTAQNLVLRAMDKYEYFGNAQEILYSLIRELGLFPYLDPEKLSLKDLLAYETYRASIGEKDIVFHRPQASVFYKLMSGKSVVLSAPTSFGKSLITDAIIASNKFNNIVIVVPTISLIDETRRRLSKFRNYYKIITHSLQEKAERNIYVLTQERVLEENFIDNVDFFVIDEFYKLSLWAEDVNRCALLNEAFYRLYKKCEHFYMLGPCIDSIPVKFVENLSVEFIKVNYNTVVTEFHDYTNKAIDKKDKLYELCQTIEGQTVIFCRSPASANEVANILCSLQNNIVSNEALDLANWVAEKYHKDWVLTKSLKRSIAIHHARIPRGISQYIVDLFNNGKIKFLICTSTLIEGVNTSARNMICYDNKIGKNKDIDFFTFNNIAGRSGRMFQHFIGHVYLFSPKPIEQSSFVDIPVYTQGENTPESLLINMDRQDLSKRSEERVKPIYDQNDFSIEVIRDNKIVEPKQQIEFAQAVRKNIVHWEQHLIWRGFPSYEQLQFICDLIWKYFSGEKLGNHSVASAKQLALKVNELAKHKSIKQLIIDAYNYRPDDINEIVGRILDFRRLWANFHFPRLLNTIESIVNDVQVVRNSKRICDYSAYSTKVENYFYDASLVALEEYGLPLEVSILFENQLSTEGDLDLALERLNNFFPSNNMSDTDLKFIDRAKAGY